MSLLAGLLLVVLFVTLDASFKDTLIGSYGRAVRPDLMVSTSPDVSDEQAQPMPEEVVARLAGIPGVSGAYAMRKIPLDYQGRRVTLKAFDEPDPAIHYGIYELLDRPVAQAGEELYHGAEPAVFVSETFSKLYGRKTGDRLRLMTPSGALDVRVVGVEVAPAVSGGLISMSRALYKRYWHDPLVSVIAVQVPRASDLDEVKRRIDQGVGRELSLAALPQNEVKERIAEVIDRSFRPTRAVEAASLLVGLLGLLNAFFVSMTERRRELGMLRAIGMARAQVYRLVLTEAAVLGAAGAVVAVACGGWIARTWILHSLAAELGWTVQFSFPWVAVLATVALGISVTLLASILPARRAARLEIRDAIGHE
jgi:putative ABC transport system permease protein